MRRIIAALALGASAAGAQSRTDAVRGRVTTDSGKAIADAEIVVTMAPTRVVVSGKSDSTGNYDIRIEKGTGEYLLFVSAVGRLPFRQRLIATGGDTVFVANVKLAPVPVAALTAVKTVASRLRPSRTGGLAPR